MPVYPLDLEAPALTGRYPQMAKRDADIWERFLSSHGGEFESVAYNVALGGVIPQDEGITEEDRLGWRYVTAKKIDAIAIRPGECWIIEVKPNASLSAIGQVLGYVLLAEQDRFTPLPFFPVIVTDNVDRDVRYVAEQLNISILVFPEAIPSPAIREATAEEKDAAYAQLVATAQGVTVEGAGFEGLTPPAPPGAKPGT